MTEYMYDVTLSIPVYNVSHTVRKSLLTALDQTFDNIEFLIVDDCGTDNSMDIVREIASTHPRGKDIRIIKHPHNIGLGATRNTAIDNAQGKYLFFLDSDDEILPDCISLLYKAMMEEPVDFVAASFKGNCSYQGVVYKDVMKKGEFILADAYFVKKEKIAAMMWNKLYDLEFLRKNAIYCIPHHLTEDIIFTMRLSCYVKSYRLLSNVTLLYNENSNSLESEKRKKGISYRNVDEIFDNCEVFNNLLLSFRNTHIYKYFLAACISNINSFMVWIIRSQNISYGDKRKFILSLRLKEHSFIYLLCNIPLKIRNILYLLILKSPSILKVKLVSLMDKYKSSGKII